MTQQRPPRPDPVEPDEVRRASFRTLILVTVGNNLLLGVLLLLGLVFRANDCVGGCPYRPVIEPLAIVLILVDAGLALVWAFIGHGYTRDWGERIGERIASRGPRRPDGSESGDRPDSSDRTGPQDPGNRS